ncbi:putative transmembrane protein [Toxoplasma gondii TgCatPRC2]|nr:hypothetical protein TGME49_304500 [Toxoplasma gondii ME49]EPR61385.1 hypothetical protein TGGT1_304500 [Toxoplasma gondii GT1]ESS33284.1 putative transmembrane protein [Toxoplasma gondii VEG]KFG32258.1 putative transmembrane protein [Toxoplasma gondii GAB2-2007-GAL-DOM2]KFG34092.1 putative transmembrane protein [Toxoplasma gondii p89]KFG38417.1 putative transmembrane protein [Toxoplasma gondii FOU]KFG59009.1 putative transmembrane protein [Toxoplasma gondii RUB]KFH00600.1 putative transm|eukprot:XP_008885977.1 hypothetical protein HHA_304500 [Hammondia hammondi]
MPPRILYLHGLEGGRGSEKEKMLEKVFGKQDVKAVNLKTRQTIMLFTGLFTLLAVLFICGFVACFVLLKWYIGLLVTLLGILVLAGGYWVAGRVVTQYMVKQAKRLAEKKFKEFRPNVIVAETFGAVVALNMNVPKVAMILLSPAQDQYTRFMKMSTYWGIGAYPYVMVVHGSHDKTIPLDDSVRLIETSEVGRCRLEVVDDNHALKGVTEEDLQNWVKEVYTIGKQQAKKMAAAGDKQVDLSLFGDDDDDVKTSAGTSDAV